MSTKRDLWYYKNSREKDAVRVRGLIWEWQVKGGDRNYPSTEAYLSDDVVYTKAIKALGFTLDE